MKRKIPTPAAPNTNGGTIQIRSNPGIIRLGKGTATERENERERKERKRERERDREGERETEKERQRVRYWNEREWQITERQEI